MDDSIHPSSSSASNYNQQPTNENGAFSRFAITVKLPKSKQNGSNDVRLVRQALETSRLKNSSSQWLHFSGSKSF
jgi:hypothetical protein